MEPTSDESTEDTIRIGIPNAGGDYQWCLAEPLSASYAKLVQFVTASDKAAYGDVVEFRNLPGGASTQSRKLFVDVVTKASKQRFVRIATLAEARGWIGHSVPKTFRRRMSDICGWCGGLPEELRPTFVEVLAAGVARFAFPYTVSDDAIDEVICGCPHRLPD